ncbi:MAG: Na+/H+ antiporter subunit G [Halofilum sp. (in: g-proteobacteria)]|nr:Na+/H+ antiporter subunit G [Halofilum sp. (in: g-proteobacteria)]
MEPVIEIVVTVLIVVGSVFLLVGSAGLLKLRELMARLHAPTKATTLGIGSILLASSFNFIIAEGRLSVHEILVLAFLFLTAPVTAHFVAKAHLHEHMRDGEGLPPTQRDRGWSTFDAGNTGAAGDGGEASSPAPEDT